MRPVAGPFLSVCVGRVQTSNLSLTKENFLELNVLNVLTVLTVLNVEVMSLEGGEAQSGEETVAVGQNIDCLYACADGLVTGRMNRLCCCCCPGIRMSHHSAGCLVSWTVDTAAVGSHCACCSASMNAAESLDPLNVRSAQYSGQRWYSCHLQQQNTSKTAAAEAKTTADSQKQRL